MNSKMNAKQLDDQKKAQERVTQPLHREDIPIFIRNSIVSQERHALDEKNKSIGRFPRIAPSKTSPIEGLPPRDSVVDEEETEPGTVDTPSETR